jgi:GAF domain-containing protein
MPLGPLADALTALSRFLVADASIGDTLQRVTDITADAIGPAKFVGISMLDEAGKATTAIFTDRDSPEIDAAQYRTGRGPCLDAWRTKATVRVDDIEGDATYPEFSRAALAHGIRSTMSMPLVAGEKGLGAMNLYCATTAGFSAEDEDLCDELATAASVVLANAAAYWDAYDLSQHMRAAMESRAVIEQAKGMLMAQTPSLDPDGAFQLLVKASQRENIKLREVALRIVERRGVEPDSV